MFRLCTERKNWPGTMEATQIDETQCAEADKGIWGKVRKGKVSNVPDYMKRTDQGSCPISDRSFGARRSAAHKLKAMRRTMAVMPHLLEPAGEVHEEDGAQEIMRMVEEVEASVARLCHLQFWETHEAEQERYQQW